MGVEVGVVERKRLVRAVVAQAAVAQALLMSHLPHLFLAQLKPTQLRNLFLAAAARLPTARLEQPAVKATTLLLQ